MNTVYETKMTPHTMVDWVRARVRVRVVVYVWHRVTLNHCVDEVVDSPHTLCSWAVFKSSPTIAPLSLLQV